MRREGGGNSVKRARGKLSRFLKKKKKSEENPKSRDRKRGLPAVTGRENL